MKVLKKAGTNIETKYGRQTTVYEDTKYRLLNYIVKHQPEKNPDEVMLFNTMTGEIILITKDEYDSICDNTINSKNPFLYDYLIRKWFLVPKDFSEKTMIDLARIKYADELESMSNEAINSFTILPTTACNARCSYCFEHGCHKISMDTKTAHDVAEFIIKNVTEAKKDGKKDTKITWFGGEPTVNLPAMSVIIDDLKAAGIKYTSSMLSNGYLLNKNMAKYLKEDGNLNYVQITIDGTDDDYKAIKNYVYQEDENPFNTVCENIIDLLNIGVSVGVRLNVGLDNKDALKKVVDHFADKVLPSISDDENIGKLGMYCHILFENCGMNPQEYTKETLKNVYDNTTDIERYIRERIDTWTLQKTVNRLRGTVLSSCMVSNPYSTLIYPDGSLAKCEHNVEESYASIYSDYLDMDFEKILSWKYLKALRPECSSCKLYPICLTNARCGAGEICSDAYLERENDKYEFFLERLYKFKDEAIDDSKLLYDYSTKTSRISPMDLSKLNVIDIDGVAHYILRDAKLYGTGYIAVMPTNASAVSIGIYRYKFTDNNSVELYAIERYEEYYVVFDKFNKMIEDSIINRIIEHNTKGGDR